MKRIEVIISKAIEEDFEELYRKECTKMQVACKFTKVPGVYGQGNSCPKLGTSVWPQENSMYIIYCDAKIAERIKKVVTAINDEYIGEGAAAFISDAEVLV